MGNTSLLTLVGLVVLLTLCLCAHGSEIVLRTRELRVKVGRAVYLDREDLAISRTRRGEECRVEVVVADPITLRVGHLDPPVSTALF